MGAIPLQWVVWTLGVAWLCSLAALIFALGTSFLRKWSVAVVAARGAFFASASLFAVVVLLLLWGWLRPAISFAEDPAATARGLAERISELMNIGALGALVALLSAVVWLAARWRLGRAR